MLGEDSFENCTEKDGAYSANRRGEVLRFYSQISPGLEFCSQITGQLPMKISLTLRAKVKERNNKLGGCRAESKQGGRREKKSAVKRLTLHGSRKEKWPKRRGQQESFEGSFDANLWIFLVLRFRGSRGLYSQLKREQRKDAGKHQRLGVEPATVASVHGPPA